MERRVRCQKIFLGNIGFLFISDNETTDGSVVVMRAIRVSIFSRATPKSAPGDQPFLGAES